MQSSTYLKMNQIELTNMKCQTFVKLVSILWKNSNLVVLIMFYT